MSGYLVADNLKRQCFRVVYFGIKTNCIQQLKRKLVQIAGITTIITCCHQGIHDDSVVVTLWMFPGLSVRKSGPAAWQESYAICL